MKRPVIIDTPANIGVFFALAYSSKQFDIRFLSACSYGNAIQLCSARDMLEMNIPVYTGAVKPIIRDVTSPWRGPKGDRDFSGLFFQSESMYPPESGYVWDAIMNEAKKQEGALEIITLGSLTNIAIALLKYPALEKLISKITIMGGARFCGNCPDAPQSEFNFYYDPEAAHIVIDSGIPILIADINTCIGVEWNWEDINQLFAAVPRIEYMKSYIFRKYGYCCSLNELVAVALADSYSEAKTMNLVANVETDSQIARGKLVLEHDTVAMGLEPNATLFSSLDEESLKKRIISVLNN
ncbi:MAG TPA: nucleoside hydrolase [Clostridiaceae bacterium]|nr:nucleoside hydrolase [Clostridiaceae bacterium]